MPNREKVEKGLECCLTLDSLCGDCPYYSYEDIQELDCERNLQHDALAVLKEQEVKWIHREDLDFKDKLGCTHFHGMCGNCGFIHDFIDGHTGQYKYCPQCGQKLDWEGR